MMPRKGKRKTGRMAVAAIGRGVVIQSQLIIAATCWV
jgi:hypothetical protein